jgi:hypothetical protein
VYIVDIYLVYYQQKAFMRDKRKKFVELAEARVKRAMNDIRLIGNLSNKSAYEFSEEDVKAIFNALRKEMDTARSRFTGNGGGKDSDFKLEG